MHEGLRLCALISIVTTGGIIAVLLRETIGFFREVPLIEFLTGTSWTPLFEPKSFGVLPLVSGTLMVAIGAGLIAMPLGLGSAIYLSEYASKRVRNVLKPILEILAGIPTVVYGYFALTVVTPALQMFLPETQVFNAASAAIVVGIMILPMIASLSDDALRAVPQSLRLSGHALGATKWEISTSVVLPGAMSGVTASFILAMSRAIGETMAVTLAAGATPKMALNPLGSIQTLTAYIVQVSLGDTPSGTTVYRSIFAVGMLLFLVTFIMNLLSQKVMGKLREEYE